MRQYPFTPVFPDGTITANTAAEVADLHGLPWPEGQKFPAQVEITNAGPGVIHVSFGDDSVEATDGDYPVLPGQSKICTVGAGATHASVYTADVEGAVSYYSVGSGF